MTYTATVESVHRMTPRVKQFRLRADDHAFDHRPGQHTTVQYEGEDGEVVRPYTPTSLPGTDGVTLAIKRYDDGTASVWMHDREPGDEVELGELEGDLHLRDPAADVAFLSTGTGITPMVAMVKEYAAVGTGHAHFVFGEKSQEDLVYRETLDQLDAQNGNVGVTYVLSREAWSGPTGHVQTTSTRYSTGTDGASSTSAACPRWSSTPRTASSIVACPRSASSRRGGRATRWRTTESERKRLRGRVRPYLVASPSPRALAPSRRRPRARRPSGARAA